MATTPTDSRVCCRAGTKESCTAPPCPFNPDAWTDVELEVLAERAAMKAKGIELIRGGTWTSADLLRGRGTNNGPTGPVSDLAYVLDRSRH